MAVQLYTFKITYANCDNKIWRTAAVSSNYTLAELGYLVLATFDTMAYHLFEMKYKDITFYLTEEDFEDLHSDEDSGLLDFFKLRNIDMRIGDVIEMTYDLGCDQVFEITLLEKGDMPKGSGRSYPKILDGAGRGIVEDMSARELLELIGTIDAGGSSGIYYSNSGTLAAREWDYREYDLDTDNKLLKGNINSIRDAYEYY